MTFRRSIAKSATFVRIQTKHHMLLCQPEPCASVYPLHMELIVHQFCN